MAEECMKETYIEKCVNISHFNHRVGVIFFKSRRVVPLADTQRYCARPRRYSYPQTKCLPPEIQKEDFEHDFPSLLGMHRNQNHQFSNGNAQRPDPAYFRSSLRRHIQEKWLTTGIGIIGLFAGIFLIVRNEARAVDISKSLEESISLVTPVKLEEEVDRSNIGKVIYVTGAMRVHEPLTEVDYGISVSAVKLLRFVQMYQWVETENDVLDGEGNLVMTNYYYHTEWQNNLIDSSSFSNSLMHVNPKEFPVKRQTQINENVKIGDYYLGLDLKKKFSDFIPITSDERPERPNIKLHSGMYYHCQNLWKPEVGDIRVQFFSAGQDGQVVTIVARLDKTLTLVPYSSKLGVDILILRLGHYSLEDVFAFEHSQNRFLTWVYRGASWLLLYLSCVCLTTFLQIILVHSTLLQEILPVSHSSLKMTVSMCMSLVATAAAWVWYRPVLGIGLITVTIAILVFTKSYTNGRHPQRRYNRL